MIRNVSTHYIPNRALKKRNAIMITAKFNRDSAIQKSNKLVSRESLLVAPKVRESGIPMGTLILFGMCP